MTVEPKFRMVTVALSPERELAWEIEWDRERRQERLARSQHVWWTLLFSIYADSNLRARALEMLSHMASEPWPFIAPHPPIDRPDQCEEYYLAVEMKAAELERYGRGVALH